MKFAATLVAFAIVAGWSSSSTLANVASKMPNVALNAVSDPGPAPTFDASEYADLHPKTGTSTIVAQLHVDDGIPQVLSCEGQEVSLYPNTAYTRWMLSKWLREVDGRHEEFGMSYPGDYKTDIGIPDYLKPPYVRIHDTSVVQDGECDAYNHVAFTNVPAGNYIFVGEVQRSYGGSMAPGGNVIVQTPNGEYPMPTSGTLTHGHMGDGYILVTHLALVVKAGQSYEIKPDNIYPAAHVLPRIK